MTQKLYFSALWPGLDRQILLAVGHIQVRVLVFQLDNGIF